MSSIHFEVTSFKSRDKYGRSVEQFDRIHVDSAKDGDQWVGRDRRVAVLIALPKGYAELHDGVRYLVNIGGEPSYFVQRKAAKDACVSAVLFGLRG